MNKIKYVLSTLLCFLLVFPIKISAIGLHSTGSSSNSSYGGSYSSSSDSSYSGSYSASYETSVDLSDVEFTFETVIIAFGYLFVMFLLLIVATIITRKVNNTKQQDAIEKQEKIKQEQKTYLLEDINFCDELLESQIQNNILEVLFAINDNNLEELSIYCTDKFIQNHKYIINRLNLSADYIAWITPEVERISSDNSYDYITLSLYFDIVDSTNTYTKHCTVILKRADKVVSKGLNQYITLNSCKTCGAPMDYKKSYHCSYCGNISKLSEQDNWMIDDIF